MINTKYQQILTFLENWENEDNEYYMFDIHDIEYYSNFEKIDLYNDIYPCDELNPIYKEHTFYQFGYSRDGGAYCLWQSPELKENEMIPVVYLDAHYSGNFISSSFEEFVYMLTQKKDLYASSDVGEVWNEFADEWDDEDIIKSVDNFTNNLSKIMNLNNIEINTKRKSNFQHFMKELLKDC